MGLSYWFSSGGEREALARAHAMTLDKTGKHRRPPCEAAGGKGRAGESLSPSRRALGSFRLFEVREAQGDFCNELLSRAPSGKDGGAGVAARETEEASERFRWELMGMGRGLGTGAERESSPVASADIYFISLWMFWNNG